MIPEFRAWDVDEQFMAVQGTSDIETIGSFAHHYLWNTKAIESGKLIIMLWIGLKDMNGIKVFKGDIVEIYPEDKKEYGKKARFWIDEDLTLWGMEYDWQHISGYECTTHIMEEDQEGNLLNAKVIGNIYQNPGMLKNN